MKKLLLLLFILVRSVSFSQKETCDCVVYFNLDKIDYKDSLTKTFYKKIKKVHEDETECLNFKIVADSADYFKIKGNDPETIKTIKATWVKKSDQFETMAIENSEESTLVIYEEPNYKSKIVYYTRPVKLLNQNIKLRLTVINCNKGWIKVKVVAGKKTYFGWVRKGGHCPNPCSNCC